MAIRGKLEAYFETGTEGVLWAVYEDGKQGYDGLHILQQDDLLKIFGKDGSVVFSGRIDQDRQTGWAPYPFGNGNGQPVALGMWVHWTQRGYQPDDWARLFVDELSAELVRACP